MPIYNWNSETMSVDVPEMDAEHRVLIGKMNATYDSAQSGAPTKETVRLYKNLTEYTREHFADEERYMEKIKYKGIVRHKAIHDRLLRQMDEYLHFAEKTGVFTTAFWDFLINWWITHIRSMDLKYGNQDKKTANSSNEEFFRAA